MCVSVLWCLSCRHGGKKLKRDEQFTVEVSVKKSSVSLGVTGRKGVSQDRVHCSVTSLSWFLTSGMFRLQETIGLNLRMFMLVAFQ